MTPIEFAATMQDELEANADKGDFSRWKPSAADLMNELEHHGRKLDVALMVMDRPRVREHAADCANILMKISELYGGS